jgi:hypothetical protein
MASNTATGTDNHNRHHTATAETKPAFKTTEPIAYVVVALGVLDRLGDGRPVRGRSGLRR